MHVQIQVKGLTKATQLRRFAARKLEVALAQFSHSIQEAHVRLNDINGPDRGGVDKLCRVVLRFKDNSIMVIEELGSEISQVIDRVVDRLHQSVPVRCPVWAVSTARAYVKATCSLRVSE